jgi:hypothetical protein
VQQAVVQPDAQQEAGPDVLPAEAQGVPQVAARDAQPEAAQAVPRAASQDAQLAAAKERRPVAQPDGRQVAAHSIAAWPAMQASRPPVASPVAARQVTTSAAAAVRRCAVAVRRCAVAVPAVAEPTAFRSAQAAALPVLAAAVASAAGGW